MKKKIQKKDSEKVVAEFIKYCVEKIKEEEKLEDKDSYSKNNKDNVSIR